MSFSNREQIMKKVDAETEAIWTLIAVLIMLLFALSSGIHEGNGLSDPVTGCTGGLVCSGDPVDDALSRYVIPTFTGTVSNDAPQGSQSGDVPPASGRWVGPRQHTVLIRKGPNR